MCNPAHTLNSAREAGGAGKGGGGRQYAPDGARGLAHELNVHKALQRDGRNGVAPDALEVGERVVVEQVVERRAVILVADDGALVKVRVHGRMVLGRTLRWLMHQGPRVIGKGDV